MSAHQQVCNRHVSFVDRFEKSYFMEPNSGCWLWIGACSSSGYGNIYRDGKHVRAHRASWELANGSIPSGVLVLHRCDMPACVNPDHLFLGSTQDNSDDKISKCRQSKGMKHSLAKVRPAKGECNGNSKLSGDQVLAIREMNLPQRRIAANFGVTQALVSKIRRGEIWK